MRPRNSTAIVLTLSVLSLAIFASCKSNSGESPGVATIRSGSPEGVRVTSTAGQNSELVPEAAGRITAALCKHERECAQARSQKSDEALLLQEQACAADLKSTAELSLREMSCSPAEARAGLEECLTAIQGERCMDSMNRFPQIVPACRSNEICRRGASASR